nr:BBF_HP1_G0028120.mRNA.1.CDS.1 [Saccharomyces cerevisiae]
MYSGTLVSSAARTSTFVKSSQCGNNHISKSAQRYPVSAEMFYCRTALSASRGMPSIRHFRWGNSQRNLISQVHSLDLIHICSSTVDGAC